MKNDQLAKPRIPIRWKPIIGGLRKSHGIIQRKTKTYQNAVVYDIVEQGLWLLKAKKIIPHGGFGDFLKSDTVSDLEIQERSARRYMQAAENAGLTHKSKPADIAKLRKAKTLHGVKPTDLYKLPPAQEDDQEEEEPEPEKTQEELIGAEVSDFSKALLALNEFREFVTNPQFERVENELHAALEQWSDCSWEAGKPGSANKTENLDG